MKVLALVLVSLVAPAAAQPAAPKHVLPEAQVQKIRQGLGYVYGLDYPKAVATFQGMISADPEDPAGYAYLAMVYWTQELGRRQELTLGRFAASDFFSDSPRYEIVSEPEADARFYEVSEQAVEKARARLRNNPSDKAALFIIGVAFQTMASFEATIKRHWWAAFRDSSHTYRYHRELLQLEPNFTDAMLSMGIFNYVAGSLDWKTKWVSLLMGYRGSKERGKEQLWTTANSGVLMADAARISLALIYTREKEYKQGLELLTGLHNRFPQNYLLHLDMGGLALAMGNAQRAIEIYNDILKRRQERNSKYAEVNAGLLYNRLGVAHRTRKDYTVAVQWFGRTITSAPANSQAWVVARLELGKTLDLLGRRGEAVNYYRQVAGAQDFGGSQKEARELLAQPFRL